MAMSISQTGEADWNDNVLSVIPQTGYENVILVSIHKDGSGPLDGETVRMSVVDFITVARALGIAVGVKIPPKVDAAKTMEATK